MHVVELGLRAAFGVQAEHDVYQRWMGLHPWPAPGPCRSYKVIKWSPEDTAPARCNWGERPTFKEFCKWYGLDPGKGLV